jgi:hypothetical protein
MNNFFISPILPLTSRFLVQVHTHVVRCHQTDGSAVQHKSNYKFILMIEKLRIPSQTLLP